MDWKEVGHLLMIALGVSGMGLITDLQSVKKRKAKMNEAIKDKLAKVYELVARGGTEGEKAAAKAALDRLIKKYNVSKSDLFAIEERQYKFKYSSVLDEWLLGQIVDIMTDESFYQKAFKCNWGTKEITISLKYIDYVTVSTAYAYFRSHMASQWKKHCADAIKRCRSAKTRNKRRKELQVRFFSRYAIESNLVKQSDIREVRASDLTDKERKDMGLMLGVEGGAYRRQVNTGLLLES